MAQEQEVSRETAAASSGRFEIREHGDGFVRLDRQTGELSYCTIGESGLACRVAAEEREAYQQALADFEERLSRLEGQPGVGAGSEIGTTGSKRQDRLAPQENPPAGPEGGDGERELDQAMNLAERAMKRFFDVIREWQRELGSEGGQQQ
jgi:hypothetical protein